MADRNVLINENTMIAIANAIRTKSGISTTYLPCDMAAAINAITTNNTASIIVEDSDDSKGGIVKTITALNIGDTTATAADVAQGKYFYTKDGIKTAGNGEAGSSISEITISSSGIISQELQPDTIYHFTSESLTSLTITFASFSSTAQYHFDFISPSTAITFTLPQSVNMPNNFTVESNTRYEIDIINNYGVFAEWIYEVD